MLLPGRCYMPCYECGRCYCQEVDGYPLFCLNSRCYCHCNVEDVLPLQYIATIVLADVIAKWQMFLLFYGQMLLPCGRWNGHYFMG